MEGAALFIGIFGLMAVGAWMKSKSDMAEKDRMFEAQKLILDRLGTGPEVTRFLETEQGKELFERLKSPEGHRRQPRHTANQTAFSLIIGGLITLTVGLGFAVAVIRLGREFEGLYIPASICVFVGIGMLIAAVVTRYLSKKWDLDDSSSASRPGTQVS